MEEFLKDNRCYFGVYGPAGSGKSFTITYFIEKHNLYDSVILSGTTNNACRVLEQSLNLHNNINIHSFFELLNIFISDININIQLVNQGVLKIENIELINTYFNDLIKFINFLKIKTYNLLIIDKSYKLEKVNEINNEIKKIENKETISKLFNQLNSDYINLIKKDIQEFINTNCPDIIQDKLYTKYVNLSLENIFTKNKYIKTIHSLLNFEQCRDENHNITFIPSKSCIIENEIKNKNGKNIKKYDFTPKFNGKNKKKYENMSEEEQKTFEQEYYNKCFTNLSDSKILIIDESSMMKEIEFRYIIYICKILKLKVIFLGDKYQLPPVDDETMNNISKDSDSKDILKNQTENINENTKNVTIDYSSAVKLKSSYTLSTIKRTSNPVLQEIYKSFRDLVDKTGQGKIKLKNIQFTKNIQPTDKYLIQNRNDIQNSLKYIMINDPTLCNSRMLCFSNKEVNRMNDLIRTELYGNTKEKYIENETLLVTNYMLLPLLNLNKLIAIEYFLKHKNKAYFNYIFNKYVNSNNKTGILNNDPEYSYLTDIFKDINLKNNKIKLHTSCIIKIIKIIETQVYMNQKILDVNIVFFVYENYISLFFYFKNYKDTEYVKNILKTDKQLIKFNTDLYRLHKCDENCNNLMKKHTCNECNNINLNNKNEKLQCNHHLHICEKYSCTLVCNSCYECNPDCSLCVKQHKNNYSTELWNKYICKEYILDTSVNYSYATTVHKSQGQSIDNIIIAEYNIVNCVLYNNEVSELQKMLIYPTCMYTAVTRTKNILIRLK